MGNVATEQELMKTVPMVAAEWKVAERRVWEWISRGELACYRLGRSVRISRAQMDDFLERHKDD